MKVSEIPVGGCIVFGQFHKAGDRFPSELMWKKASASNEFYASGGIGCLQFDAIEPDNESRDRRERGSNFWPQSNLCQFLNAEEKDWFKPQHETDMVDVSMSSRAGFLHLFEDWEKRAIVPHEITTTVPVGFKRKFGEHVKTTAKVSILSRSQVFGGEDLAEGEQLQLFASGVSVPCGVVTRTAVNTCVCAIDRRGRLTSQSPASQIAVMPLIRIDGDYPVEYNHDQDAFYLLPPEDVVKAITDELDKILK